MKNINFIFVVLWLSTSVFAQQQKYSSTHSSLSSEPHQAIQSEIQNVQLICTPIEIEKINKAHVLNAGSGKILGLGENPQTIIERFQAQKNDAKQFFYFSCELNHNGVAGSPRYSSSEGNGGPVAIASPISRSPIKENNAQENEFKRIMQEEIFTRQRLNAEDFDKSILTYASAGIAISITLLTTIIPFKVASYLGYLYLTWASFLSAIVATISSFYTGNKGLDEQLEFILQNQNKQSFWDGCTHVLNMISGVAFILGIVFALIFFYKNLNKDKPKESLF